MSYFIHNKYDADSVAQLSSMQSAGHTIIDYYGLLEAGTTTYKNIDTSDMPCVVTTLEYSGVNESNFYPITATENEDTKFKFSESIIIKSIQSGVISANSTININPVNTDKCSVRIECSVRNGGYATCTLTATTLKVNQSCRYEIIEFL